MAIYKSGVWEYIKEERYDDGGDCRSGTMSVSRTIYRYKEYKGRQEFMRMYSALWLMQDYGVNLICVEEDGRG